MIIRGKVYRYGLSGFGAITTDAKCKALGGECVKGCATVCTQAGKKCIAGLCPGPADVKCCVKPWVQIGDEKCIALGGECYDKRTVTCAGDWVTGKCAGGKDRVCCVPHSGSSTSTGFTVPSTTSYPADQKCISIGGTCVDYCQSVPGYVCVTGKCGGPSHRRCLVPAGQVVGTSYNDTKCTNVGGVCVDPCIPGGGYTCLTGYCDGPVSRRCRVIASAYTPSVYPSTYTLSAYPSTYMPSADATPTTSAPGTSSTPSETTGGTKKGASATTIAAALAAAGAAILLMKS